MQRTGTFLFVLAFMAGISLAGESDTRAVQSEFDRCKGIMERINRSIQRFQDIIADLKRTVDAAAPEKREAMSREVAPLESKVEYFRGRFDRATGQTVKISCDLKSAKGGRCSSCLASCVNLNSRNAEIMLTDVDDQIAKATQLQSRWRRVSPEAAAGRIPGAADTYAHRRSAIDSVMGNKKTMLDSCSSSAGKMLWTQCKRNVCKADSLHAAGATASEKALDVAELLFKKALDACGR